MVLITGGSRGRGLVMARQFADEGARLAIMARSQEELDRAEQDLESRGAEVLSVRGDVSRREEAEEAVRRVLSRFGRIDVLVNNAGIIQVGPVEHMSTKDFEDAMGVHLWGPYYLMMAAIPHMKEQGGGRVVNVTSIGGKIAVPHLAPYSVSKFALVGLSDALRAELWKDHIHVTTVAPGLMRTGSPVNAPFKGDHEKEYAWFVVADSLPFTSTDAETAARQILEACRRGDPDLTITIQARLAILASTLSPGLFAKIMQLTNRLLPKAAGPGGDESRPGKASESTVSTSALTRPTYSAAEHNNEFVRPAQEQGVLTS